MKKNYWVGSYVEATACATAKTNIAPNDGYKELACAVMKETVREYFHRGTTAKQQTQIIKELKSNWCEFLTNGLSIYLAEQLIKNPEAINERFRKEYEEEMR